MVSPYETQLLRAIIAAQLCQIGFEESSSRAIDVLTHVFVACKSFRFWCSCELPLLYHNAYNLRIVDLHRLGARFKTYSEHATRIRPTPLDLIFVFDEFRLSLPDLQNYAKTTMTNTRRYSYHHVALAGWITGCCRHSVSLSQPFEHPRTHKHTTRYSSNQQRN